MPQDALPGNLVPASRLVVGEAILWGDVVAGTWGGWAVEAITPVGGGFQLSIRYLVDPAVTDTAIVAVDELVLVVVPHSPE